MKSIIYNVLLIIAAIMPYGIHGQYCTTPIGEEQLIVSRDQLHSRSNRSSHNVVKVFVHITKSAGNPAASIDTVMDRMDDLRIAFSPHNICFVIAGIDYINDNDLASQYICQDSTKCNLSLHEEDELIPYLKPGMLNIFVHNFLTHNGINGGGNAYGIPNPYLSLRGDALSINLKYLLTHEVGHCLGLYHTHENFKGFENVARTGACSNCANRGDLLCDTPADPDLSVPGRMSGCTYVGTVVDACSVPYTPDPSNIMSYSPAICASYFSTEQGLRCNYILNNVYTTFQASSNLIINQNANHNSGLFLHSAENSILFNASSLSYTSNSIMWSGSSTITVNPGTTFSPGSGSSTLLSQKVCNN